MSSTDNPAELFNLIAAHKRGSLVWEEEGGSVEAAGEETEKGPSRELRNLCEEMMEPDPTKRISIAQIRVSKAAGSLEQCMLLRVTSFSE